MQWQASNVHRCSSCMQRDFWQLTYCCSTWDQQQSHEVQMTIIFGRGEGIDGVDLMIEPIHISKKWAPRAVVDLHIECVDNCLISSGRMSPIRHPCQQNLAQAFPSISKARHAYSKQSFSGHRHDVVPDFKMLENPCIVRHSILILTCVTTRTIWNTLCQHLWSSS